MAVTKEEVAIEWYFNSPSTLVFGHTIFAPQDLLVFKIDGTTLTSLALDRNFSVQINPDNQYAVITIIGGADAASYLVIRSIQLTQILPAKELYLEDILDKLVLSVQDIARTQLTADPMPDNEHVFNLSAEHKRITNLGDALNDGDAVSWGRVKTHVETYITGEIQRLINEISEGQQAVTDAQTAAREAKAARDDVVNTQVPLVQGYKDDASSSADKSLDYAVGKPSLDGDFLDPSGARKPSAFKSLNAIGTAKEDAERAAAQAKADAAIAAEKAGDVQAGVDKATEQAKAAETSASNAAESASEAAGSATTASTKAEEATIMRSETSNLKNDVVNLKSETKTLRDETQTLKSGAEASITQGLDDITVKKNQAIGAIGDAQVQAKAAVDGYRDGAVRDIETAKNTATDAVATKTTEAITNVTNKENEAVATINSEEAAAILAIQNTHNTASGTVDTTAQGYINTMTGLKNQTESLKVETEGFKNTTQGLKDATQTLKDAVTDLKGEVTTLKDTTKTYKDQALTAEQNADKRATDAYQAAVGESDGKFLAPDGSRKDSALLSADKANTYKNDTNQIKTETNQIKTDTQQIKTDTTVIASDANAAKELAKKLAYNPENESFQVPLPDGSTEPQFSALHHEKKAEGFANAAAGTLESITTLANNISNAASEDLDNRIVNGNFYFWEFRKRGSNRCIYDHAMCADKWYISANCDVNSENCTQDITPLADNKMYLNRVVIGEGIPVSNKFGNYGMSVSNTDHSITRTNTLTQCMEHFHSLFSKTVTVRFIINILDTAAMSSSPSVSIWFKYANMMLPTSQRAYAWNKQTKPLHVGVNILEFVIPDGLDGLSPFTSGNYYQTETGNQPYVSLNIGVTGVELWSITAVTCGHGVPEERTRAVELALIRRYVERLDVCTFPRPICMFDSGGWSNNTNGDRDQAGQDVIPFKEKKRLFISSANVFINKMSATQAIDTTLTTIIDPDGGVAPNYYDKWISEAFTNNYAECRLTAAGNSAIYQGIAVSTDLLYQGASYMPYVSTFQSKEYFAPIIAIPNVLLTADKMNMHLLHCFDYAVITDFDPAATGIAINWT